MAKFQLVGSNSPHTIAHVNDAVDIESFHFNDSWYRLEEAPEVVVKKEAKPKLSLTAKQSL